MTIPRGWATGFLGKSCDIEIGGTPSRGTDRYWDLDRSTENAWVSIKDMRFHVITHTAEQISDLGVKYSNVKLQPAGTVLLSFKLTIGRVAFAGRPLYTNEAIAGLRPRGVDPEYLYHGLQQWDLLQGVDQAIKGATLNKEKLKKISFIYPVSDGEQFKIAEVLSTVDRAIAQTEALIAKQQRIKTGLMQDLLTRGIDEHGRLRSEATHRFKDSALGRIPVEWEVASVKSLLRTIEGGWSPSCIDEPPGQGEWGVLKVSAVSSGVYQPSESKRLPSSLSPIPALEVQQNDVLLSRANGVTELVGRCAYVPNTPNRLLLSDKTLRLQPILKRVDPYILSLLLGVHSSRLQIVASLSGSSGQKNISQAQIHAVQVRLPPLGEQQHLMSVLEKSSKRMRNEKDSLRKLRSIKSALMQDLLTGKVRVTPLLKQAEAASA